MINIREDYYSIVDSSVCGLYLCSSMYVLRHVPDAMHV